MSRAYRGLARRLLRLTKNDKWRRSLMCRRDDAWDRLDSYSGDYDCHHPAGQGLPIQGGFRYLGNGAYSWVFTHYRAPGVVFKVTCGNSDDMLSVNRAFMQCKHKNMPVIYAVHETVKRTPAEFWTQEHYDKGFINKQRLIGQTRIPELIETMGVVVSERLSSKPETPGLAAWEEFKKIDDELETVLQPFGIGLTDVHSGNMMWRGDTIVVIDPTTYVRHTSHMNNEDDE